MNCRSFARIVEMSIAADPAGDTVCGRAARRSSCSRMAFLHVTAAPWWKVQDASCKDRDYPSIRVGSSAVWWLNSSMSYLMSYSILIYLTKNLSWGSFTVASARHWNTSLCSIQRFPREPRCTGVGRLPCGLRFRRQDLPHLQLHSKTSGEKSQHLLHRCSGRPPAASRIRKT